MTYVTTHRDTGYHIYREGDLFYVTGHQARKEPFPSLTEAMMYCNAMYASY